MPDLPQEVSDATRQSKSLFNAVLIFDQAGSLLLSVGSLGQDRGEFWLPVGIFIDENDQIYVADTYNQRIQILKYIGGPS